MRDHLRCYFHNLKFDGSFWIDYLIRELKYKQAYRVIGENSVKWVEKGKMPRRSFQYAISDKGQWYCITICTKYGKKIEIWDSLKLLPFSLKQIGKSFQTKHQKLEMEYEGERHAGGEIKPEELEYLKNDVYVLKEGLEAMLALGHDKLTIGSCCLKEFRDLHERNDYNWMYPNLYEVPISECYGAETAGQYIRKSYKGAWTYLVRGKEGKVFRDGLTADVNSLYPSMMHGQSGNKFPVGLPCFWTGDIPERAIGSNKYYFVKIRTSFRLKEGYLPTIQMKGDWRYCPTEFLERSAVRIDGKYYEYERVDGKVRPVTVELTLTETDWELIQDHYELYNTEILNGCWFFAERGIFDQYIDKYMQIKMETKDPVQRQIAKLFLNNLYGKLASSPNSSFKLAYMDGNDIKFRTIHEEDKVPGYIPCGSAITSYARNFTIRHAQENYYGKNERGFIYADTDSIHCDLQPEELKGIDVHPTAMSCWKLESYWDEGYFVRQKTYIEHVTHSDGEKLSKPYYHITCAGMPDRCKKQVNEWIEDGKMDITGFDVGLEVGGKLIPKRIPGGIVLKEGKFKMREKMKL